MHEMKMDLLDYIRTKKNEVDLLNKEVKFFNKIKIPLRIEVSDGKYHLYSKDYSLATNFEFKIKTENFPGLSFSSYDGGYTTTKYELYPQFYFNLKKGLEILSVLIQHEGFFEDKNIILKSKTKTIGCKDYKDQTRTEDNNVNYKKSISFFEANGVSKNLIKKLNEEVDRLYEVFF